MWSASKTRAAYSGIRLSIGKNVSVQPKRYCQSPCASGCELSWLGGEGEGSKWSHNSHRCPEKRRRPGLTCMTNKRCYIQTRHVVRLVWPGNPELVNLWLAFGHSPNDGQLSNGWRQLLSLYWQGSHSSLSSFLWKAHMFYKPNIINHSYSSVSLCRCSTRLL